MIKIVFTIQFIFAVFLVQAQSLELDSILNLHFEKAGGIDNWKNLKTYYLQQSRFFVPIHRPIHERTLGDHSTGYKKIYYQYPNQERTEFYYDTNKLSSTFIINRNEAKRYIYSHMNEMILPEDYRKAALNTNSLHRIGPTLRLLNAHEDGKTQYNRKIEAYGKLCHMFIITDDENPFAKGDFIVYIDTVTHLIHATATTAPFQSKHKLYTDYRKVDGLIIPHNNSSYDKGILFEEYLIQEININGTIDNSLFSIW